MKGKRECAGDGWSWVVEAGSESGVRRQEELRMRRKTQTNGTIKGKRIVTPERSLAGTKRSDWGGKEICRGGGFGAEEDNKSDGQARGGHAGKEAGRAACRTDQPRPIRDSWTQVGSPRGRRESQSVPIFRQSPSASIFFFPVLFFFLYLLSLCIPWAGGGRIMAASAAQRH